MSLSALDALRPLRETIARYNLSTRKALGQHFLCDLNLTRRIVECAGDLKECTVFEIGPGPGGLTRALLASPAKKIIAIEKDHRCVEALAELHAISGDRLEIIEGDALKIDLTALTSGPYAVVANLPYNVGTELFIRWLRHIDKYRSLTLMFQSEVVDRLTAEPNSKAYGRLSVITQFCCEVKKVLNIPARAFTPPPKVDSSVVHLTPRHNRPQDVTFDTIGSITASAFGQRRKMLRSSLRSLGGESLLAQAGIDAELRAENLSNDDFVNLARAFKKSKIIAE